MSAQPKTNFDSYMGFLRDHPYDYQPSEEELYNLTLHQIWRALLAPKTNAAVRQKYHVAILRWSDKFKDDPKKRGMFGELVSLVKGKDEPDTPAADPEDQGQEPAGPELRAELGAEETDS